MSLKNVSKEILASAEKNALSIEDEGRAEAKAILQEAKRKADEILLKSKKETEDVIGALERKETASAKIISKKPLLDAKKDIIEETYETVEKRIASLDDKTRKPLVESLLKQSLGELSDAAIVYAAKKDALFVKKATKIKVIEQDMLGGVIVENTDNTIRINNSFETLLEIVKKETLKDTAEILFK
ncbi:MAG: hypothetical protein KAI53_03415 [Candidatus Aenigmarchaeota archaeon]|nr:hypothetical protein [Candidatus Aenigmarchaeota archaeon]